MKNKMQSSLCLKDLLSKNSYKIPVYQRNYNWGKAQIQQLITDVIDVSSNKDKTYYLGSLVVHDKNRYYEILDGQQRFTTLSLLIFCLKYRLPKYDFSWYKNPNLSFESRPKSDFTINSIFKTISAQNESCVSSGEILSDRLAAIDSKESSASILSGLKTIDDYISSEISEKSNIDLSTFADYLLSNVKILRITVPKNTDVTHYFEVMNNRGEQLEKHEIVKANLLSAVQNNEQDMEIIQKVWLACSNMSRYVQTVFSQDERVNIFGGSCEDFIISDFDDLRKAISQISYASNSHLRDDEFTFERAIENGKKQGSLLDNAITEDDGREERFTSVIDFPNFLMHVLRICTNTNFGGHRLPLDDKGLIQAFTSYIENTDNKADRAKKFIYNLLKIRYLFDRYIVKRERVSGKEDWSLKCYKLEKNSSYVNSFGSEDSAKNTVSPCVMLLSAFHVSYPANSRKNWLSAVLYWLNERNENDNVVTEEDYTNFLERLARSFMLNRYLTTYPKDYESFIYTLEDNDTVDYKNWKDLMRYGRARVFSFNYLDYLLWKNKEFEFEILNKFRFTSNNSTVEHFSPQQPKANEKISENALHSFGNLCLMANTDNSSLSNDGPKQKAYILKFMRDSIAPLSLKLELMLEKADAWNASTKQATDAIFEHEEKMINILRNVLGRPIN